MDEKGLICLAKALSPRGNETIETCKLNRSELAVNRRFEWDRTIEDLGRAAASKQMREVDDCVSLIREGKRQYSGACMSAVAEFPRIFAEKIRRRLSGLGISAPAGGS
jgi:hypothetical protein